MIHEIMLLVNINTTFKSITMLDFMCCTERVWKIPALLGLDISALVVPENPKPP